MTHDRPGPLPATCPTCLTAANRRNPCSTLEYQDQVQITWATALLLSGVAVHVVSRRLGHADVQTTLNTYAHVTEDARMRAVAEWKAFTAGWRIGADRIEPIGPCS
jgi:hypothetical protein